eukprot:CAMPEP_0198364560 /NCGR_PEP_ID=MMETSP1450-20131203/153728_1 /TAXON_ID=753684 ORGANISM="Madagascaria erythrocladiodes, Strain CCMP3234" /NCGR_SAMPLE_ID=MMETSP1450 /ASSEMBLY_ACC=CAM_ASM_001115 /LENGTH=245 /DNA_ID=CAMNT_0044071999 /DNA_START=8 /DNA_END=745 /DNA_ORIENTATION=-
MKNGFINVRDKPRFVYNLVEAAMVPGGGMMLGATLLSLFAVQSIVVSLVEASPVITTRQDGGDCGGTCRFSLCDVACWLPTGHDVPSGRVCSPTVPIGIVAETGEALLFGNGTRISVVDLDGLTHPFSSSFFKAYAVRAETGEALLFGNGTRISAVDLDGLTHPFSSSFFKAYAVSPYASGIGSEDFLSDDAFIDLSPVSGACVILPLKSYQLLDPQTGQVVENIQPGPDEQLTECVSFNICPLV